MKQINPSDFTGSRSYFTNFDHRIVGRTSDLLTLRRDVERNLKILLLFKSKIVCGASHLVSPFAFEILKDNPTLISEGHVIPALRSDKPNFVAIAKEKKNLSAASFLDEQVPVVVRWDVVDNSSWFQDKFVNEFKRPDSLIRQRLSPVTDANLAKIIAQLQQGEGLGRNNVSAIAKFLQPQDKEVLLNYRELVYHISGARVVNCESALPQENYIDFNFEHTTKPKISLTETQIAWKLFIELALQSLQARTIPVEILDVLTFDDIIQIRQPILASGFHQHYDDLLRALYAEQNLIGSEQLISRSVMALLEGDIKKTFDQVFEQEMPRFLTKRMVSQSKEMLMASSSIALGVLGLIPGMSLAGVAGLIKDSPSFMINLKHSFKSAKSIKNHQHYVQNRELMVTDIINKYKFSDSPMLLEAVDYLSTSIRAKLSL